MAASLSLPKSLFFCSILFICQYCCAQSYTLSPFPDDELSSKQINCIFQDHYGFIWIGTANGLNLYNANSIKIFKHNVKNKNSLLDNNVQDICEDKKNNIWIAEATGIDCYDPSANTFKHFTSDAQNKPFAFKPTVYTDHQGNIWVGSDFLFKFDTATQQFTRIVNTCSDKYLGTKYNNRISGFFQDSNGRYWVSTFGGLFLLNDQNRTFTRIDSPVINENYKHWGFLFGTVNEDKNGQLRVGTWDHGLYKILITANSKKFTSAKLLPVYQTGIIVSYSSQQLENKQTFWFSNNGLVGLNQQNKLQTILLPKIANPFSLRNTAIKVLFTDRQDQLWIGFENSGIQILSPGNQLFQNYPILSPRHTISAVDAIAEKADFLYLGGWYNSALCKLDKNYKPIKWWDHLNPGNTNSSDNIGDIYFDKYENTWLATGKGLTCLNETTGEIKTYTLDSSISKRSFFLRILPEGDSVLWLAGYSMGLSRFSLKTHRLELINQRPTSLYWKIVHDKAGNIWCANDSGFIEKFDPLKMKFTAYHFDSLTERSMYFDLSYDTVNNTLWVASSNGLLNIDVKNLHARLFTEEDGLPTTKIDLLLEDTHQRLWIGTERGLSLYDPVKNSFRNFYVNNGLSTEQIDHTLFKGTDGKLYIGSDNSFIVMDVDKLEEEKEMSPVYITNLTSNGKVLQQKLKDGVKTVDLPYNQNNITFQFAIADFINPTDNQLFYKLSGWDKNFTETKNGSVTYNKLPAGKYIFNVKGINHNGVRNDKGDSVILIVHPPFWSTWWFISIISAVSLLAFILLVRYISQRNLKERLLKLEKEQAVEKERNRISHDMHDDLGSGLTKIAIMSEVAKKQINEPEKARQQLENISQSSRELIDSLQDIIWILNPKNDTLESLAAYMREYALKFFEPFAVDVQFNYPENFADIKLSEEIRRSIFLVVKESLNNIAKHAWCNWVLVCLKTSHGGICLKIEDDGKGFETTSVRQFGNGLNNMRTRIEQIGGSYNITSLAGEGTMTELFIPV